MSTTKLTSAEALRKTIRRSREDALAQLSPQDKELYDKIVGGSEDAIREGRKAELNTPLYDASTYVIADYRDLLAVIQRLDGEEEVSTGPGAPSGAAAPAAPGGFPGLPSMPGFPGLPGLPGMSSTPTQSASSAPAPVGASQTTVEDVIELFDAWKHRYGTFKGVFESDIIDKAIKVGSKELVIELMDRDVFRVDSVQRIKKPKKDVTYVGNRKNPQAFDIVEVPMYEYLLDSCSTALYETVTEHPVGKEMFLKAAFDSQYKAIRFAFDTSNKVLLEGLLDTGVDISTLRDLEHNTPLMVDFLYRVQDGDEEQLRLLVEKGANMTDTDQLLSTALMVAARIGNLKAMQFLLEYDVHDVYAKNIHGETVLSIAEAGPEKRKEAQESYDEGVQDAKERYEESKQAWEVQARAAEAAGKKPPPEPKEPQFKPRPEDYPVELVTLVQDVWVMGDPTKSKQAQLIAKNQEPDEYSMEFDADF